MKILALDKLLPSKTFEDIKPHLKEEAEHAWKNYEKGLFRELYMRGDRPGAVVILECKDIYEAKKIMDELPLVKKILIKIDFIPLGPFISFSLLFIK
jgi:hypothetical protein